jgi:hypothetical protein
VGFISTPAVTLGQIAAGDPAGDTPVFHLAPERFLSLALLLLGRRQIHDLQQIQSALAIEILNAGAVVWDFADLGRTRVRFRPNVEDIVFGDIPHLEKFRTVRIRLRGARIQRQNQARDGKPDCVPHGKVLQINVDAVLSARIDSVFSSKN